MGIQLAPIEGTPYAGGTATGIIYLDANGLQRTDGPTVDASGNVTVGGDLTLDASLIEFGRGTLSTGGTATTLTGLSPTAYVIGLRNGVHAISSGTFARTSMTDTGEFRMRDTGRLLWTDASSSMNTPDTSLSRISAGVTGVGTGIQGSVDGTLSTGILNAVAPTITDTPLVVEGAVGQTADLAAIGDVTIDASSNVTTSGDITASGDLTVDGFLHAGDTSAVSTNAATPWVFESENAQSLYYTISNRKAHPSTQTQLRFHKSHAFPATSSVIGALEFQAIPVVGGVGATGASLQAFISAVPASGSRVPMDFVFSTESNNRDLTESLRITGDGYVGINTATPSAMLNIVAAAITDTPLMVEGAVGQTADLAAIGDVTIDAASNVATSGTITSPVGFRSATAHYDPTRIWSNSQSYKIQLGVAGQTDHEIRMSQWDASQSLYRMQILAGDAAMEIDAPAGVEFTGGITVADDLTLSSPTVPASASATGVAGTVSWDADYIYICTATDTWKRVAISTW